MACLSGKRGLETRSEVRLGERKVYLSGSRFLKILRLRESGSDSKRSKLSNATLSWMEMLRSNVLSLIPLKWKHSSAELS